jgi:hypothetical protein
VTREAAAREYGVMLDEALAIDEAETMRWRNKMSGEGIR